MRFKTNLTKVISAIVLTSAATAGVSSAKTLQRTERPASHKSRIQSGRFNSQECAHPIPREMAEAAEKEARRLLKQRRFAEARAACLRATALVPHINGLPTNMNAVKLLGDVYLEQKRYRDAIRTYDRAREQTRNMELNFNTALAYLKLGDMKNARRFYSEEKVWHRNPRKEKSDR